MVLSRDFYVYVHKYASGPQKGDVFYVGKGKGKRAWERYGRNTYWDRIVKKYDYCVCIVENDMYEVCAFTLEKLLIGFYGIENLANLTLGGEGSSGRVPTFTDDHRRKISISKTGPNNAMYGKPLSQEHRDKIGAAHKGRIFPDEHLEKIKRALGRPVRTECGLEFYSMTEAEKWLKDNGHAKASHGAISRCCNGKLNSAYGYKWYFA